MSLATITNDILKYAPGLNSDLIKSIIQSSYEILCARDWAQLKLTRTINTVGFYSTGTVSIDATGNVVGSGTTFTSGMVGRFMKVYYTDAFFEIQSFTDATHISLKDWAGAVVSGKTFSIFKTIYSVDPSFGIIFNIIYQVTLLRKSQAYFNKIDPARTSSASSPLYWAYAGKASNDAIQVEIYPPCTQVVPLRIYGKIKATTLGDDDIPKLPEPLVRAAALVDCFEMKNSQQPRQGWDKRRLKQEVIFTDLLAQYEDEDAQLDSFHDKVKDTSEEPLIPWDDTFAASHDVG